MKMRVRGASILVFGLAVVVWGQQSAPPPSPAADGGPTLASTMQFIQEKLSQQAPVGWAETRSTQPRLTRRSIVQLADVMADPAACTLYTTETVETTVDLPKGKSLLMGGKQVSADDLHSRMVETDTISFKQVEKIAVEKLQDIQNKTYADAAHPEITVTLTPSVFYLEFSASSAVFSAHTSTTKGNQPAAEKDVTSKIMGITFRDEETANRLAKAMIHAMELCGGGAKKEVF